MSIIPKKKRHNGKIRAIEGNHENEETSKNIKDHIDKMSEYMSSKQLVSSLRQHLKGKSSLPKTKYKDEMNDTKEILNEDTDYGKLAIHSRLSPSSVTNPIVTQAFEEMGFNIDDIFRKPKRERKLSVNTDGLKERTNVDTTCGHLKEISESSPLWREDSAGWIAYRLEIIKEQQSNHLKYNYHYNRAKNIFSQATNGGSFPTTFVYKGVSICWESNTKAPKLHDCVLEFINQNYPDKLGEYEACLKNARSDQKKYTLVYLLDDIDYDEILGTDI